MIRVAVLTQGELSIVQNDTIHILLTWSFNSEFLSINSVAHQALVEANPSSNSWREPVITHH
jgi:hypothetical protein